MAGTPLVADRPAQSRIWDAFVSSSSGSALTRSSAASQITTLNELVNRPGDPAGAVDALMRIDSKQGSNAPRDGVTQPSDSDRGQGPGAGGDTRLAACPVAAFRSKLRPVAQKSSFYIQALKNEHSQNC